MTKSITEKFFPINLKVVAIIFSGAVLYSTFRYKIENNEVNVEKNKNIHNIDQKVYHAERDATKEDITKLQRDLSLMDVKVNRNSDEISKFNSKLEQFEVKVERWFEVTNEKIGEGNLNWARVATVLEMSNIINE